MADYSQQSRFFFKSYEQIQDGINSGLINKYDIVLCSDTREMILVSDTFDLIPIHSKVMRFTTINEADTYLNNAIDTYQGQIVQIFSEETGSYQAYIVNQNAVGGYYVSPISTYSPSDVDYNVIGNRPIENMLGNIENPVVLGDQPTGIYRVNGAYKIADGLITVFQSYNSDLFTVTHDQQTGATTVRCITGSNITTYIVGSNGDVIGRDIVATQQYLRDAGYMTEEDVDAKIAAINVFTKEEAYAYIQSVLADSIDKKVNDVLDQQFFTRLSQALVMEDQENIRGLFK